MSDLRQSVSQIQIQRAEELDEVTSKREEIHARTPIDKSTRKPFATLSKDDLIRMLLEAHSTIEKLSLSEKVQAIRYTPSKYQQSKQGEICQEFLKVNVVADKCEFSHEEDGSLRKIENGDDVKKLKKENSELREYFERMKTYILDEANTQNIIHRDTACDACKLVPIRGARNKCI